MRPVAEETNSMNKFKPGLIEYEVLSGQEIGAALARVGAFSEWSDGYLAFSNDEKRLDESVKRLEMGDLFSRKFKRGDVASLPNAEGYLMEVGLWCELGGILEEICVEREDMGFHIQKWTLHRDPSESNSGLACYYRYVDVLPRKNTRIFKEGLKRACEVVVPEKRLHFFITYG